MAFLELVAARRLVLDDDELHLQLRRELHEGRQDHDEGALAAAGGEPGVERLGYLGHAEVAVEVAEHEQGRAVGRGQRGQGADGGDRVGGAGLGGPAGQVEAAVDVPAGEGPALGEHSPSDLLDGVVVLAADDVDAC